MGRLRNICIWAALVLAVAVAIGAAMTSPLLQWRGPIYIAAGLAGVIALALMLFQPLLAAGYLPGLTAAHGRRIHRRTGLTLVLLIIIHVAGLWVTSPPDVIDALLFVSPTPFSIWGVIAMWGLFATVILVVYRRSLPLRPSAWRLYHRTLAAVIVTATVLHALMIEGTMEWMSKSVLCALVVIATALALISRRTL